MDEKNALRAQIVRLEQGMQAQQALRDSQQEETSMELAATKEKLEGFPSGSCTAAWVRMHALFCFAFLSGFRGSVYIHMPDFAASS